MSEPESLGEIISRRRWPPRTGKAAKLDILELNWARVAGDRIAGHTTPTRISRGVLTVSAEGASWASEASMQVERILSGAAALLGKDTVRRVRVRASSSGLPGSAKAAGEEAAGSVAEGPGLDEEVVSALEGIAEEQTRGALGRMLRASKAASRASRPPEKP